MRTIWTVTILGIVVLGLPFTSFAQSADNAKAAFAEGKELFAKERYTEAANKFRQAYEAKKTWKLLYNIG